MLARAVKEVLKRPFTATAMLWRHRRTICYLWRQKRWRQLYNFVFVTYFVRGEDCGKGVLDFAWKLWPSITPFLWDLEVEVTTRCYLRCIHCEHTYWPDKSYLNQDLSFWDFKKMIDGVPKLKWVNLTGEGSSFLNKNFMTMLRYCRMKGLYIDFSHDFYQMTDEVARELIMLGVERIYVSIDGATKETYEKVRVGSDFDRVTANIRRFVQLKKEMDSPLPEICFRMAFFKDNIHEVEALIDLIHSFGDARDLGDEPSINIVGLLEFEETRGWVREIDQATVDRVNEKAKKYGFTIYWSHPSHDESKKPPLDYCMFWSEPYIMIGNYVLPCCAILMSNKRPFLEKYAFGNLNQQSLKEIWDSPRFTAFRRMVTDPHGQVPILCAGCRTFNTTDRAKKYGVSKEV
jgi:MoaA/NifB/PqqE/SkfB family radical SAM enzyme